MLVVVQTHWARLQTSRGSKLFRKRVLGAWSALLFLTATTMSDAPAPNEQDSKVLIMMILYGLVGSGKASSCIVVTFLAITHNHF